MKRIFDLFFAFLGIMLLLPIYLLITIFIKLDSKGEILYKQERIGKDGIHFYVFKFRTMIPNAFSKGALTVGSRDPRVTNVGYYLRKYKLDELPQLFNVLIGDMSFVGPRPEVKKYTDLYNENQRVVLSVKPGITDYASIKYRNENDLLAQSSDPEKLYIEEIMPEKLNLNLKYINDKFGHLKGDQMIQETVQIIKRTVRSNDLVARLGGDEFGILNIETNLENTQKLANRISESLKQAGINAAIGVAARQPGTDLQQTVVEADKQMYRHKRQIKDMSQ